MEEDYEVPSYLQLDDSIREQEITLTVGELHSLLYQIDWIRVLKEAVEGRPSSWGVQEGEEHLAVSEWRNSSDELIAPVWKNLFEELVEEGEVDDN